MRRKILLALLVLALLVTLPATQKNTAIAAEPSASGKSTVCNTDEARKSAEKWTYDPVDAFEFGLRIQQYVEREDLQSLFGLVNGELDNGPRKKFIQEKSFSEIFSQSWREAVLSEKPDCIPMGWRGFMLGRGKIWYKQDYETGEWKIFSINGDRALEAKKTPFDGSWKYNGELLTTDCFTKVWYSSDNYEHYYDTFVKDNGIDRDEFFEHIGRFIGGPVPIAPIVYPWAEPSSGKKLSLAVELSGCLQNKELTKITMDGGWVAKNNCRTDAAERCLVNKYRLIKRIPLNHCRFLAPYFSENCIDLGLVQISEETGGTMGPAINEGIYGIIKDPTTEEVYVVPLVNFDRLNDALNYVDQLVRLDPNGGRKGMYVSESWIINLLVLYFLHSISIMVCDFWHRANLGTVPSYVLRPTFGKMIFVLLSGPLYVFAPFARNIMRKMWGEALTSAWEVYYTVAIYGVCLYDPKWAYIIGLSAAHFIVRRFARYTYD